MEKSNKNQYFVQTKDCRPFRGHRKLQRKLSIQKSRWVSSGIGLNRLKLTLKKDGVTFHCVRTLPCQNAFLFRTSLVLRVAKNMY